MLTENDKELAMQTYLTTDELATRIHYDARTIRTRLKDAVLLILRQRPNSRFDLSVIE